MPTISWEIPFDELTEKNHITYDSLQCVGNSAPFWKIPEGHRILLSVFLNKGPYGTL